MWTRDGAAGSRAKSRQVLAVGHPYVDAKNAKKRKNEKNDKEEKRRPLSSFTARSRRLSGTTRKEDSTMQRESNWRNYVTVFVTALF
jgi:hypothetical protein